MVLVFVLAVSFCLIVDIGLSFRYVPNSLRNSNYFNVQEYRQFVIYSESLKPLHEAKVAAEVPNVTRQLLGMKEAESGSKNIWALRLQLTKPVTWIPLMWGVMCGAAASGNYHTFNPFHLDAFPWQVGVEDVFKSIGCMILAGPLLTGYTQTLNDWEDRHIDAINEPYRPIPSGAITKNQVISQILVLLGLSYSTAFALDNWAGHTTPTILLLSLFGSFISYIYSAPPLKLKAHGWLGSYALGSSYIALPWLCGQAMFNTQTLSLDTIFLTLLYSIAGLGIAIVNDFKSIEGDAKLGLNSIPVMYGVDKAKWISVLAIDVTQLAMAIYLSLGIHMVYHSMVLLALLAPQVWFQVQYLLKDPLKNDVKYQASAQPFLVLGILTTALAIGSSHGGGL